MFKSYKYRIYPAAEQKQQIEDNFSICRYIYNIGLELKQTAWRSARINIGAYALSRQFTEAKKEFPWLGKACSSAVESTLSNLDAAYKKFYAGAGYPKFKSKRERQSFTVRADTMKVDFEKQLLTAGKIKKISVVISRPFSGKIKRISIGKSTTGKYYAAVLVDTGEPAIQKPAITSQSTIGIDLGVKSFAITSDGRTFAANQKLKDSLKRLRCLQRRASRKRKGSANRRKAVLKLALQYEKISNQRADYIHKITTGLIRDNQAEAFVVENLNISGLVLNHSLARSIYDASFGEFLRQMKYKCEWYGRNFIIIDRFAPSSKRCNDCGEINQSLTLTDREWTCTCGALHDRDLNAAKNIKYFGLEKYSGRDTPGGLVESSALAGAKKQEVAL